MKKLGLIGSVLFSTFLMAGKNVAPPPAPPVPVVEPPLGLYVGVGGSYAYSKCTCEDLLLYDPTTNQTYVGHGTTSGHTYGYNLRLGYDFNDFLGVETRFLHTPWKDDDKSIKHLGLYLKPTAPLGENFDIYALLGYGRNWCDTQDIKENSFAWGVGAEYLFGKKVGPLKKGLGVYIEYSEPFRKNSPKKIRTHVGSVGVAYHF
ncbi:MAG: porin family protein [Epsilonproteobacteria bacterium]|nr:porin family protein [Campylobacterota bacterium]